MSVPASDVFPLLPAHLRLKIDDTFQDFSEIISTPGPSADSGGGFIVEEPEPERRLKLAAVKHALERLDLAELLEGEDGGEVMNVFKEAASGWNHAGSIDSEGSLGLDDWRSVCAVLLEHYAEDRPASQGSSPAGDGDVYMEDADVGAEVDSGADDDEYVDEKPTRVRRTRTSTRKTRRTSDSSLSSLDGDDEEMQEYARQASLEAYALFFPDTPPEALVHRRIMIKDIQRVAGWLKEKITAEEVRLVLIPNFIFLRGCL